MRFQVQQRIETIDEAVTHTKSGEPITILVSISRRIARPLPVEEPPSDQRLGQYYRHPLAVIGDVQPLAVIRPVASPNPRLT